MKTAKKAPIIIISAILIAMLLAAYFLVFKANMSVTEITDEPIQLRAYDG